MNTELAKRSHLEKAVSDHYSNSDLLAKIYQALPLLGLPQEGLTPSALSAVDEFHIGGSEATKLLAEKLSVKTSDKVLDIGCGIGGPARFISSLTGCSVRGIDLTADYVAAGNELTKVVGLAERVELTHGSALEMTFSNAMFDVSYMMHVGMNIANKGKLMEEAFRVTKQGGVFGVYDVMLTDAKELIYPLPWAESNEGNAIASVDHYKDALAAAGFTIKYEEQKTEFAIQFFEKMSAVMSAASGPPPLGLHLVMGPSSKDKVANVFQLIKAGIVAPVILVATK